MRAFLLLLALSSALPCPAASGDPWINDEERALAAAVVEKQKKAEALGRELEKRAPGLLLCRRRLERGDPFVSFMNECYRDNFALAQAFEGFIKATEEIRTQKEMLENLVNLSPEATARAIASGDVGRPKAVAFLQEENRRYSDLGVLAKKYEFTERDINAFQVAYGEAQKELARRRLQRIGLGGLSALVLGAGLWLWRFRRRPASEPSAPSAPALGGKYRIDGELGRGGMGVVLDAFDLDLRRPAAIKNMSPELDGLAEGKELFLREAQVVASLKHPNIVEIYEVFEEAGRIYQVFEKVSGRGLNELAGGGRRLPLPWIKAALEQVCAALAYAHSKKVIHRDLKPSNIMVGADGRIKVMDFGIARQMTGTSATKTRAWGTPPYMAPEQELGEVSPASDLYALGVCLYEMAAGTLPFSGGDLLRQKQEMAFPSPADLPPALNAFLRRALKADPAKRPRTAAEFAAGLSCLAPTG